MDNCFTSFLFPIKKIMWRKRRNRSRGDSLNDDNRGTMETSTNLIKSIPADHAWKVKARKYQQSQFNSLGDRYWDIVPDHLLDKKIGFAVYGLPTELKDSDLTYTEEKMKHINKLKNHIISLRQDNSAQETYLACISVFVNRQGSDSIAVVFRLLKGNENLNEFFFIDTNGRTYKSWDDYLENNELPKCYICYPLRGFYTSVNGFVEIGFCKPPACKISRSILTGLDITSSVVGLGAAGVTLASLAVPIAAPFVWGATATILASGAYDIGRGVNQLLDIGEHKESLSPMNPKSRKVWLNVLTSTVGIASVGVTRGLAIARTGQVITKGEAVALRIINISSLAFSGISGFNTIITVVIKYLDGTLGMADVLQFSSACYFFLNALLSIDIANRMIEEIASSDDITGLFFSTNNSDFSVVKSIVQFFDSNSYEVLRRLVLGAIIKFMPNINLSDLEAIAKRINGLLSLKSGSGMDWNKFAVEMISLSDFIWRKFGEEILNAKDKLCEIFNVVDWKSIFMPPSQESFLDSNLDVARQLCLASQKAIKHCTGENCNDFFMKRVLTLASVFHSKHPAICSIDFLNLIKFVCESVVKEFDELMDKYMEMRDEAQTNNDDFDCVIFDRNYGIEEEKDIRCYFLEAAIENLWNEERMNKMISDYSDLSKMCEHPINEIPSMETSASYHYMFSEPLGQSNFTDNHYWQKLNKITGLNFSSENATLLKQNNIILIHPNDSNADVKAALFYTTVENGCVMGILTVIKNN